jgi:predicted ester cyclase
LRGALDPCSLRRMVENDNTAIVRRWFEEVWNRRRLETIDELLDPDAVAYDLGGAGATTRGIAAFRAAAEMLHTAFGQMHFTVEDIFGVEDRVAVRLSARLRHTGPLGDLPATGNEVSVPVMCMIRLRDGKLIEGWNNWDVATALRAANAPATMATIF